MECLNCGGPLQVGKASYVVNRHGYHLIIVEVPAFICAQCGQPLFTEDAVQLVQQMIYSLDAQRAELNAITLLA
jgi:YgiT-type zinc finger domain-containing protein